MSKLRAGAWYRTTVPYFFPQGGVYNVGHVFQLLEVKEMTTWPGRFAGYASYEGGGVLPGDTMCIAFQEDLDDGFIVEVEDGLREAITPISQESES